MTRKNLRYWPTLHLRIRGKGMNDSAKLESYGILIGWDAMIKTEKGFYHFSGQLS
jgi:hypothetical protein